MFFCFTSGETQCNKDGLLQGTFFQRENNDLWSLTISSTTSFIALAY